MNRNKSRVCYCNITYRCNNNCRNCISHNVKRHTDREVTVEDYIFFKEHFHLDENDIWTISGGEPTLSNNFVQIVNYCHNVSPHIIVYSNGRRLNLLPTEILKKIERIIVPVYGEKAFHNRYVNSPYAYDETMRSLKKIIDIDPNKIDIKFMLQEYDKMEQFFDSVNWSFLKQNKHFSVSRVLPSIEKSKCPDIIAKKAERIIKGLSKLGKNIRFYDIPVCLFTKDLQEYLSKVQIEVMTYDPIVICGSSEKRYKLFPFNKPTDILKKCISCSMLSVCSMIMQNYFCPMLSGSKVIITTE